MEELVSQRVQVRAKLCALIRHPASDPVQNVRDAGDQDRPQRTEVVPIGEEPDKERNEEDAEDRQGIREIHGYLGSEPRTWSEWILGEAMGEVNRRECPAAFLDKHRKASLKWPFRWFFRCRGAGTHAGHNQRQDRGGVG